MSRDPCGPRKAESGRNEATVAGFQTLPHILTADHQSIQRWANQRKERRNFYTVAALTAKKTTKSKRVVYLRCPKRIQTA